MVDALQNGWVGDLMDESMKCMGRQLKMMMKQVIAVIDKGNELTEKSGLLSFAFLTIEVDSKISLQVFGEFCWS
jgi:hypothetical protein